MLRNKPVEAIVAVPLGAGLGEEKFGVQPPFRRDLVARLENWSVIVAG